MPSDPNSLVDFLKAHKRPSDKDARRLLWGQFQPNELYRGTLDQNSRLLSALRLADLAPRLELIPTLVPLHGEIKARVISETPVLIENYLSQSSIQAQPNEVVTLGTAEGFGFPPLHVKNAALSMAGQLTLLPSDGQIAVAWWSSPVELENGSIVLPLPDEAFAVLVQKFLSHLPDVYLEAASLAANDVFNANALPGFTFQIFGGIVVGIVSGGGGLALYMGAQGGSLVIDFVAKLLIHAVDLSPEPSQDADKQQLKLLITAGSTVTRMAIDLATLSPAGSLCRTLDLLTILDKYTIEFLTAGPNLTGQQIAGKIFSEIANNQVSIVCKVIHPK